MNRFIRKNRYYIIILLILVVTGAGLLQLITSIRNSNSGNGFGKNNEPVGGTEYDKKIAYMKDNPDEYPKEVVDFSIKYPEAIDYSYDYPKYKNTCKITGKTREAHRNGFPLYIQWEKEFGYCSYNTTMIGTGGCGVTAFAILMSGLTGDFSNDPAKIAAFSEKNGYCTPGHGTNINIMTEGAAKYGFKSKDIPVVEKLMKDELDAGKPLVINVGPGEFTFGGHYMVVDGYDEKGFMLLDPNSPKKTDERWPFDSIKDQIKFVWSYEKIAE
ncbi:MAG: hypothetical protein GXZ11_09105 [Tissierellia bacterium]|nr:hypothetical protein [Tissierellia bacterium]